MAMAAADSRPEPTALLRDPTRIAAAATVPGRGEPIARLALACLVVGAMAYGASVGSLRGGLQIAFASLKLPVALLATLVVTVPALHAFTAVLGLRLRFAGLAVLTLAGAGRMALVLLAFAPPLALLVDLGAGYHEVALLASLGFLLAGLAGTSVVARGLPEGGRARMALLLAIAVFFAALAQSTWLLRPYLVRPRSEVVFLRPVEGDALESLATSTLSALGIYTREAAPLPSPRR